ncbi:STAS domain-containing protein [Streptomyces sp. NPDC003697]
MTTNRTLTVARQKHPSGVAVLTVTGELDHHTAPRLAQALEETTFGTEGVVMDLSDLTYCDSTGITVLITGYHRAQAADVPLLLAGLNADLMRVFRIVGLDQVFRFEPTVEGAVESLRP